MTLDSKEGIAPASLLGQIYLSLFVLFFRINKDAWPESFNADAHKGVAGITLLEVFLAISVLSFAQIITGHRVMLTAFATVAAPTLYFVNSYFLLTKGTGTAFEKKFNEFARKKQIALYSTAIVITLVTVAFLVLSVAMYRLVFPGIAAS